MSTCSSCGATSCPDPVQTINQTAVTVAANTSISIAITGSAPNKTVTITAATAGYWLIRVWLILNGAGTDAQETLQPPSTPGISQFFKVTNSAGVLTFTVGDTVLGQWQVVAAVIGPVVASGAV